MLKPPMDSSTANHTPGEKKEKEKEVRSLIWGSRCHRKVGCLGDRTGVKMQSCRSSASIILFTFTLKHTNIHQNRTRVKHKALLNKIIENIYITS